MSFLREIKRRKVYLVAAVFLTVIGIIAAISNVPPDAFPRAQVAVGLNVSAEAKATVTEYYLDHGQFPSDNVSAGLPPATDIQGKYVSSVQIDAGEIVVTFGNDANSDIHGNTLVLRPKRSDQLVIWACFSLDIAPKNLPRACRQDNGDK
jgi:type IV pilus assembly protein PilA